MRVVLRHDQSVVVDDRARRKRPSHGPPPVPLREVEGERAVVVDFPLLLALARDLRVGLVAPDRQAVLALGDVGELVCEEPASARRLRGEPAAAEHDVASHRERAGAQGGRLR